MPNVIRVGDPTSHGGRVVGSGVAYFVVSGKAVAVVGDPCTCPVQGHQNCVIATGNPRHIINGKAVAYEGATTSCGATLMSTVATFSSS